MRRPPITIHTITLEQYREWEKTASRPLTDDPIGHATIGRRQQDARHSRLIEARPKDISRQRDRRQRKETAA